MDYTDEGKKNQKQFAYIKSDNSFEKYVFDFVLKDDDGFKATQYVRGLLNKTSNETLFIRALTIATRFENNKSIWGEILYALKTLITKNKKIKWIFSFLNRMVHTSSFDLFNYDIKTFMYVSLFYENKPSTWYIAKIWDKPRFVWWRPYVEQALLQYIKLIDEFSVLVSGSTYFNNMYYYNIILDNIPNKGSYNDVWFSDIIKKISVNYTRIDGFYGSQTIEELMKKYEYDFCNNESAIKTVTELIIKQPIVPNSLCDLYLYIIDKWYHVNTKIYNLTFMVNKVDYEPINLKLYELTNDEQYLPQTTKDIFIF